eukprot:1158773-Pelagomonas_calceolata.AAC.14
MTADKHAGFLSTLPALLSWCSIKRGLPPPQCTSPLSWRQAELAEAMMTGQSLRPRGSHLQFMRQATQTTGDWGRGLPGRCRCPDSHPFWALLDKTSTFSGQAAWNGGFSLVVEIKNIELNVGWILVLRACLGVLALKAAQATWCYLACEEASHAPGMSLVARLAPKEA